MIEYIAIAIIIIGLFFILFGIIGLFRFKDFYARILITSKVEILGSITLMIGIVLRSGLNYFTLKVIMVMVILIITNPLATHSIARSAYKSGYNKKERKVKKSGDSMRRNGGRK